MRVIVCGGRDFHDIDRICDTLDQIHAGAPGADACAGWAISRGVQHHVCNADWDRHGRAAGPIRNLHMIEWGPDLVVAFPGGKGTANMIKQAQAAGVPVRIV